MSINRMGHGENMSWQSVIRILRPISSDMSPMRGMHGIQKPANICILLFVAARRRQAQSKSNVICLWNVSYHFWNVSISPTKIILTRNWHDKILVCHVLQSYYWFSLVSQAPAIVSTIGSSFRSWTDFSNHHNLIVILEGFVASFLTNVDVMDC